MVGNRTPAGPDNGFTLIELLVVLAILALLVTIAVPRYIDHVERARETALKTDLKVMREAIDKFDGDQGRLPASLNELVERRYLKDVPVDPITDKRDSWIVVTAAEEALLHPLPAPVADASAAAGAANDTKEEPSPEAVADVRSGAPGTAKDGSEFGTW